MLESIQIGKIYLDNGGIRVRCCGFVTCGQTQREMVLYQYPNRKLYTLPASCFAARFLEKKKPEGNPNIPPG